jgi:hypothetical protein
MTTRALVLCAVAIVLAAPAGAQNPCTGNNATQSLRTCTATVAVTPLTLPKLGRLVIATNNAGLTAPSYNAFDVQYLNEASAIAVTVSANVPWDLRLRNNQGGGSAYWSGTSIPGAGIVASTTKPASELLASPVSGSGYQAIPNLQASHITLLTSQAAVGGRVVPLYLRSVWSYTYDTPGSYSLITALSLVLY